MPQNQAAWIETAKANPFVVKEAPYTSPGANEIVVKNAVVAINPVDPGIQANAWLPMNYPNVLGSDIAGVVEEVGEGVTDFKKGDRVIAYVIEITIYNCETARLTQPL